LPPFAAGAGFSGGAAAGASPASFFTSS